MSYNEAVSFGSALYNILASETGLVTKTAQGDPAAAHVVDGRKVIQQGDLFAFDGGGIGVVADTYDFEDGQKKPIAVVVAGHLLADRVSDEVAAKKDDFIAQGLYLRGAGE